MHGTTSDLDAASQLTTWSDHNARGLEFASEGAWADATTAFTGAAKALATESDVASHEALALVLSNLAQSSYRDGRIEEAIAYAQRVCALRVALVGEDAIVVARARTDLAVMLSSTGRTDEALALVTRAISSIERTAGDECLHLQYALENAARLAMSSGQPSSAEPYLLRLHALLGAHELPTDRADVLLAQVSQHRASASASLRLLTPAMHSAIVASVPTEAIAESVAAPTVVAEDVVVEEIMPVATNVTVHEPVAVAEVVETIDASSSEAARSFAGTLEELTLEDTTFETKSPSTSLLGIDFDLVETTPTNAPAIAAPAPVARVAAVTNVLGFEVSYGTQTDEEAALSESIAPPVSVRVPTPPPAKVIPPPAVSPPQAPLFAASAPKPVVQAPSSAPRAASPADDNSRDRKIRLPKILFR